MGVMAGLLRISVLATFSCVLLLSTAALPADIAPDPTTIVTGDVRTALTLTRMGIEQLPPQVINISTGAYKGVLLSTLLDRAGVQDSPERSSHRRHLIVVTGRDGDRASLSMGELESKGVLLAYDKDGQPLPEDGLRLIVPGDHYGDRYVRDVVKIDVQ